jgi:hypothetical protein
MQTRAKQQTALPVAKYLAYYSTLEAQSNNSKYPNNYGRLYS